MGQMIQANKLYTFSYRGATPPVTWMVDAINEKEDQIYLHQVENGKTLQMSLKQFCQLHDQYGVPAEQTQTMF
ncbi:hypothetical protein [Paenibacillus bouchesdurhonensis]|uniref:hypothetical protein n=1 Tax=Paenibacillus bouchesdurhonensis TaxID=1870990 RepID=UPI000DA64052|nr:hypothetical protein [Paenibacillus bouchesdurhonensis]